MSQPLSALAREHFDSPRNLGRVPGFEGIGRARSVQCDDRLEITVSVTGDAVLACFRAQGCSLCIAAASLLTERVRDAVSPADALAITADQLALALEAPEQKRPCVAMAPIALRRALDDAKSPPRSQSRGTIS